MAMNFSSSSRLTLQAKDAKTPSKNADAEMLDLDWDETTGGGLQIAVADFPVQVRKMMAAFDANGDGIIDSNDLTYAARTFRKNKQQRRWLGWGLLGAALTSVLMVLATVGLVYAVLVMTKDTAIVGDALVSKATNDLVMTRPAVYRIVLQDLPLLPAQDLDKVEKLQLHLPTGTTASYRVTGYELTPNETVTVFTSAGLQVHILTDTSITLKHENGTTTTVWQATDHYRARRATTGDLTDSSLALSSGTSKDTTLSLAGCLRPPCLTCCW